MTREELIQQKNEVLLDLECTKRQTGGRRRVIELASRAASLESRIASLLLDSGRTEDAVVNLVSEASCFVDAERPSEAHRAWRRALALTNRVSTRTFIESHLASDAVSVAGRVFAEVQANIETNDALRRPQKEAYAAARQHFAHSSKHAIVQLPVGCGKTGAMAILPFGIAEGRTLVVAPNLEIHSNLYQKLDYTGPQSFLRHFGVLKNGRFPACAELDTRAALSDCDRADILVSNIQQLVASGFRKWIQKFPDDYFDMILVDEGHHGPADSWHGVFNAFPRAKVASFTATPIRADGQRVEGERIYHFPIAQAIREGFIKDIATWRLDLAEIEFVYNGSRRKHAGDDIAKLREEAWFRRGVALSRECNEHIVDASIQAMQKLRADGEIKHQIIAAACNIDHAKAIASLYRERNVQADVLHSKMPEDEQAQTRRRLNTGALDAIVHVGMLGEGADYPRLGVAAILRPYAHVMPYVQFIGRVMRVNVPNAVGHPDNRGFVVSHPGLHVDRWWDELKQLDADDEAFLRAMAEGDAGFQTEMVSAEGESRDDRRRYRAGMQVVSELVEHFLEERFLPEGEQLRLDDLLAAIADRGYSLEELGLSRPELERRVAEQVAKHRARRTQLEQIPVQPQRAREEARRRLDERVKSAASELLVELGMGVNGRDLDRLRPNLPAAIVLINQRLNQKMGWGKNERDLAPEDALRRAHDEIDVVVDELAAEVRSR